MPPGGKHPSPIHGFVGSLADETGAWPVRVIWVFDAPEATGLPSVIRTMYGALISYRLNGTSFNAVGIMCWEQDLPICVSRPRQAV